MDGGTDRTNRRTDRRTQYQPTYGPSTDRQPTDQPANQTTIVSDIVYLKRSVKMKPQQKATGSTTCNNPDALFESRGPELRPYVLLGLGPSATSIGFWLGGRLAADPEPVRVAG